VPIHMLHPRTLMVFPRQKLCISTADFFFGSVEILFFLYSFILCGSLENDPRSPPEGEAAHGEHPLDPLFLRDIFQPYQELSQ
jgi:hypothetical protein